jgi:arylformamidase
MTLQTFDISRRLEPDIAVWPGDTPFSITTVSSLANGDSVNLTTLTMSSHTGTHVDAPYHFVAGGRTLESVDLDPYWGIAQVVTVEKSGGPLFPADFSDYDLGRAPRLLVHSATSEADPSLFPSEFVYPSPELADYLGEHGVVLYGTDGPTMDAADSKTLPGHHALHRNGIVILEGLDLSGVPDGLYELVALPLKIANGDGSPVRAVLRTVSTRLKEANNS